MSKLELAAEIAKDAGSVAGLVEAILDAVEERHDLVRRLFGLFTSTIDTIHIAALEHEGYYTNLAKSRYSLFKALKEEGFTDDQAMLLMVDNDLKMAKVKDRLEHGTGGDKK